ncbi:MAG TPA: transcriptional regulator, partial [Yinghuangia sp.]|nr:transcriptional regulator [Yinghuangia sp.]
MTQDQQYRNTALEYWIVATGLSYGAFARELRTTCANAGRTDLAPDSSRVSRWLGGESPRPPMPDLIAATLTRLCGVPRPLNPADLGFRSSRRAGRPAIAWQPDAVLAAVLDTTRSDLMTDHHQEAPSTPLPTGDGLMDTVRPWLDARPGTLPTPVVPGRVGMSDVERIRATTEAFRSWNNEHGGGLSRDAVVAQLRATATLLRHGRSSGEVGHALFSAVADLASVAGWMTHDVGRHAESQQYFLLGLQAAKEADDQQIAGHLLNCMARQASHLRRVDDALELVEFAHYGTRRLPDGRLRAVLTALQARCLAIMGDLRGFQRAAGAVQDSLTAATDDDPPFVEWFDEAEYGVTIGVCHLIAARHAPAHAAQAVTLISQASATRPEARVRSRAFDQIALARA